MSTLLLSGWTQPVDALAHLAPGAVLFDYSEYRTPDEAIDALSDVKPDSIIGWSMGGQLAIRAIAAGALKPQHLTLIGTPMQFVGPEAMGEETFQLFRASYATDPARTKTRFHGLIAKGDRRMREVMELLGHHPKVEDTARWLPWLDDLAGNEIAAGALSSLPTTLIVHGAEDHIVPVAQAHRLQQAIPKSALRIWEEAGHAPHLHDADGLREAIAAHRQQAGVA